MARDRVFYNVRRRLTLFGADVDIREKGRLFARVDRWIRRREWLKIGSSIM